MGPSPFRYGVKRQYCERAACEQGVGPLRTSCEVVYWRDSESETQQQEMSPALKRPPPRKSRKRSSFCFLNLAARRSVGRSVGVPFQSWYSTDTLFWAFNKKHALSLKPTCNYDIKVKSSNDTMLIIVVMNYYLIFTMKLDLITNN